MGNFIDLTGQQFGKLTAIERVKKEGDKRTYWKCLCECGKETVVWAGNLKNHGTISCGCARVEAGRKTIQKACKASAEKRTIDLLGQKFGHLTVIQRDGSDARGEAKWLCECDCENHSRISVLSSNLRTGHTQSCGCDRSSRGEKKIASLLIENSIPFTTQKRFEELGALSFDFYINNHYFIEYDGETHYQHNLHGWHDEEQLKAQQMRDSRKNQWCLENNIPLIRIPYTHFNDLCIEDLQLETTDFLINKEIK